MRTWEGFHLLGFQSASSPSDCVLAAKSAERRLWARTTKTTRVIAATEAREAITLVFRSVLLAVSPPPTAIVPYDMLPKRQWEEEREQEQEQRQEQ
mmetsp:Transcript_33707/g.75726  ORF Transcript_33707/g.75726 Transcript_33707/m.75726 type:complete len:96 (-) Transcript_33707:494-781(-)